MVTTRRRAVAGALCAWLAAVSGGRAFAQEPIQATVDRAVVRDNESFTYVLRAEGAVRGDPEVAPLAAQFDILNTSSSRRIGVVNARATEVNEWQFQLMPKSAGEFTIPALRVGDRQSNAVTVRVLAPDPNATAAADIFMELSATPETVYAQSQVLFTLKLFVGVSTGRATLTAPETTGVEAIVEKLGEDSQYQTTIAGRDFIVRERRYAVFPQQAGTLTIGPVTFEAMVIPERGFSRVQRFRSDVLELTVQPAVAPPAGLAGAAWLPAQRVTLTEEWSEPGDELAVGIPRTRTIVVEGLGLLETQLPDVPLETQTGVRQYADRPELTREITPEGLASRRSVSYAVIAQTPGELTLSGVRLPWWNVTEQRWEVAELPPRALRVSPSTDVTTVAPVAEPAAAPASAAPRERNVWPWVSSVLALAWLATVAVWWRGRASSRAACRRGAAAENAGAGETGLAQDSARPRQRVRRRRSGCSEGCAARLCRVALRRQSATQPRSAGRAAARVRRTGGACARGTHLWRGRGRGRLAWRRAQNGREGARKRRPRGRVRRGRAVAAAV